MEENLVEHEKIKIGDIEIYADEIVEMGFNLYEDESIVRLKFRIGMFADFETTKEEKQLLFDLHWQWDAE